MSKDDSSGIGTTALLSAKEQWSTIAKSVLPFSGPVADVHWVKPKKVHGKFFLFFGVILPLVAMTLELWTHCLARYYFDPFPSAYHVVLFTLIPLSNLMAYLSGRMDLTRHYASMALFSGMAMGVGVLYTLMFLSITPTMCLAILACGIGLLGLAPLLSLPCTFFGGKTVVEFAHKQRTYFDAHQVEHIGHLIVLVMIIAIELPSTLTRVNLAEASEPERNANAITFLRNFGSQEVMLRACYERSGRATDVLGTLYEHAHPIPIEDARRVFYQVTGKAFNSVPIPASARSTIQKTGMVSDIAGVNATVEDEFDLDADIAGEAVSGIARGLTSKSSKIFGTIDSNAAIAKFEWTIALENSSKYDREARAKLLLPPGAVVTQAKIVINNQEREATIMTRSIAREIYRQNVVAKKDPLLVSTCGIDRILVQCFPVRPSSKADVKLTVIAPLAINPAGTASLELPVFEERNFVIDGPIGLEFQSNAPIDCNAGTWKKLQETKPFKTVGSIDAAQLSRFNGVINVDRDPNCHRVWCHDSFAGNTYIAERLLKPQTYPLPKALFVVVDGSEAMEPYRKEIMEGLSGLPDNVKVEVTYVGDETRILCSTIAKGVPQEGGIQDALDILAKTRFQGGQDDEGAILRTLDEALKNTGSVLWIHACQPMPSTASTQVKQFLQSAQNQPLLYDLQVATGPNEILSGIDASSNIVRVKHTGQLKKDLKDFFSTLTDTKIHMSEPPYNPLDGKDHRAYMQPPEPFYGNQYLHYPGTAPNEPGYETDASLAQLRAYDQVLKDTQANNDRMAIHIASQYHLVSPVSSAIVNVPVVDGPIIEPPPPPTAATNPFDTSAIQEGLGSAADLAGQFFSGQLLVNSISAAFSATISQLNNLSSAAAGAPGSAGGGGGGFGFGSAADEGYMSNNSRLDREPVLPPSSAPSVGKAPSSFGDAYSSQGDTGIQNKDLPSDKNARIAQTQQYVAGQVPMLQGATNGTVGSGERDKTTYSSTAPMSELAAKMQVVEKMEETPQLISNESPKDYKEAKKLVAGKAGADAPDTQIAVGGSIDDLRKAGEKSDQWGNVHSRRMYTVHSKQKERQAEVLSASKGSRYGQGAIGSYTHDEYSQFSSYPARIAPSFSLDRFEDRLPIVLFLAAVFPGALIFLRYRKKGNFKL